MIRHTDRQLFDQVTASCFPSCSGSHSRRRVEVFEIQMFDLVWISQNFQMFSVRTGHFDWSQTFILLLRLYQTKILPSMHCVDCW